MLLRRFTAAQCEGKPFNAVALAVAVRSPRRRRHTELLLAVGADALGSLQKDINYFMCVHGLTTEMEVRVRIALTKTRFADARLSTRPTNRNGVYDGIRTRISQIHNLGH